MGSSGSSWKAFTFLRNVCAVWLLFTGAMLLAATPGGRIILLRHGERVSLLDHDSKLSPAGERRAEALAPLLEAYHPALLIASSKARTQQTLAPLAARIHLPLKIWDANVSSLAEWLKANATGATAILCWHHDEMRELARDLGVPEPIPAWSFSTYDKLWIITLEPGGQARLVVESQRIDPHKIK